MHKIFLRRLMLIAALLIIGGLLWAAWIFFKPHRDVQASAVFKEISADNLLKEFSQHAAKANAKYLAADGNSKVLIVTGQVFSISRNQNNDKVLLPKADSAKMGVRCTFLKESWGQLTGLRRHQVVRVKGAITAGNSYDSDIDLYNDALLMGCSLVK